MAEQFKAYIKGKYPDLDTDRIMSLIDQNVAEIKPNPENPEKGCVVPIDCDLNKHLIVKIISEYLKNEQIKTMRLVKWKTMIQNQHAFEYDEFHLKGTVMIEDDTLSDEDIRSRIEERLLTQDQRDNRVSKISIDHIPVI